MAELDLGYNDYYTDSALKVWGSGHEDYRTLSYNKTTPIEMGGMAWDVNKLKVISGSCEITAVKITFDYKTEKGSIGKAKNTYYPVIFANGTVSGNQLNYTQRGGLSDYYYSFSFDNGWTSRTETIILKVDNPPIESWSASTFTGTNYIGIRVTGVNTERWSTDRQSWLRNFRMSVIYNPKCRIRFYDSDGSTTYSNTVYNGGATVTVPTPTKSGYKLKGWSKTIGGTTTTSIAVASNVDVNYYAVWELATVTATFKNYDGTTLQTATVNSGSTPSYTGATPTKPEDDEYTYTFSGWSPALGNITANTTYTAQFTATPKPKYPKFTQVQLIYNGNVISETNKVPINGNFIISVKIE